MGLAASQARLLSLTARKSNVEFRGQQINQNRLALTYAMEQIANEYANKMSNRQLFINVAETSGSALTQVMFDAAQLDNMGYTLAYSDGKGVTTGTKEVTTTDPNTGVVTTSTVSDPTKFMDKEGIQMTSSVIEDSLRSGLLHVVDKNSKNTETNKYPLSFDWRSDPSQRFVDKYDTSDDEAAAADYEAKSTRVQGQDKRMEMELTQLDTEHKAIETELDAVKKVIDKNIQSSFKTFG